MYIINKFLQYIINNIFNNTNNSIKY